MQIKRKRIWLIFASLVSAIGILSLIPAERWQGGFLQAEYRFTFLDRNHKPIKGVVLSVEDDQGKRSLFFPVTDYRGNNLKSDENGVLAFHHVRSMGVEASGECHHLFFLIPLGQCRLPKYKCSFSIGSKVIRSIDFNELNRMLGEQAVTKAQEVVTVSIQSFNWPPESKLDEFDSRTRFDRTSQIDFPLLIKTIIIE
jgi:hypothetical protein